MNGQERSGSDKSGLLNKQEHGADGKEMDAIKTQKL